MSKTIFLILGLFAALATISFAQNSTLPFSSTAKLSTSSDNLDPLGILESDDEDDAKSGVKASVIVNMAGVERAAFDLINQRRADDGLLPLIWNDELAAVARIHSQNMAEFSFFSHRGLDSKLVSDRADARGIGKWRSIGENIAFNRGFQDPTAKAVQLWLDSPTHKRNLLDCNWKESAVGVAVASDGSYYFTQVFLTRR